MSTPTIVGPRQLFSEQLHKEKYRLPGESFRDSCSRVASALKDDKAHYLASREVLLGMRFLPAGRVQSAMGAPKTVTAYNCFVGGTIPDSFVDRDNPEQSSIMHRAEQGATTMRMGGGLGNDFSTLRPTGARINKISSASTGPIAFMGIFNSVGDATSSTGERRGAQMAVLRIDHPDIELFINAKHDNVTLKRFNISVGVTDKFMECLETGEPFPLQFGGTIYRYVDPEELWDMLMRSTWDWSEPGVLFIDRINDLNNLYYVENIAATNPCVPAGTKILTRDGGWLPIETLVGKDVEVWNGSEWAATQPRVTGHNQDLVRVTLSNGQALTCTKAHQFILSDGTRSPAEDLIVGETLYDPDWPVVEGGDDVAEAYAQGVYAGDGWLLDGKPYVSFKREDKKSKILPRLNSERVRQREEGYVVATMTGLVHTLDKNFVPDNSWSVRSRLDWLAGLLDTDGCLTWNYNDAGRKTNCTISLSSKSLDLINSLALFFRSLGVSTHRAKPDARRKVIKGHLCPDTGPLYTIGVRSWNVVKLRSLGLDCARHDLSECNPSKSHPPNLRVKSVESAGTADTVYCFTEPTKNMGAFDGIVTGQCGEQPLPPHGACLLGSYNLVQYIRRHTDGTYYFDYDHFEADIPLVTRMMDNIIDRTIYPLEEQRIEATNKRRMGMGVTGLANAAEVCGAMYGSPQFIEMEHKILSFLTRHTYLASTELAAEKGSFPLFDQERYSAGKFVRTLDDDVQELITRNGIRNSHLISYAPTGTISMTADNISSSIEPVYQWRTERPVEMPTGKVNVAQYDYGFREWNVRGRRAANGEVSAQQHVDVLVAAQAHSDSAVSKTVNCDETIGWENFKNIYIDAHRRGAKGCTTFQKAGKRFGLFKMENEDNDLPFPERGIGEIPHGDPDPTACYFDPQTGRRTCE